MNHQIETLTSMKNRDNKSTFVVILGAGESGVGAALLAKKLGMDVFVSDFGKISEAYKNQLIENQINFEEEKHSTDFLVDKADMVIKSPGISNKVAIVKALKEKNIEIIDEIEFASRYTNAKIIAVTGSNGKTTTTRLIYHILRTAGLKVGLAGNVGYSLAKQVAESDNEYYALEISSFQLDGCNSFNPYISILTNITPDHLDRYDYKYENYIASKFRLVQNKKDQNIFIYNADNEGVKIGFKNNWKLDSKTACIPVSMNSLSVDSELLQVEHTDFSIPKNKLTIQGWHNRFNISCAVIASKQLGINNDTIIEALSSFENEAHRLESVAIVKGVEFINDSKATNVDSVFYALEAMKKPVIWIVGGIDKGNDYSQIFELVRQKVKAIVCLGKDNSPIIAAFQDKIEIITESESMEEAIKKSIHFAEAGDVVLLSPACSSFDLFNNYKHRGNVFKEIINMQKQLIG